MNILFTNRLFFLSSMLILIFFQRPLFELYPIYILGKSAYLIIFLLAIFLLFYIDGIASSPMNICYHILITVFIIVVFIFRSISGIENNGILNNLINSFPLLVIPAHLSVAKTFLNKPYPLFHRILFVVLVMQALLAMLFTLG